MPITGKLIADFESFHAAVNKADIELKALDSGAGKVSQSLNRMANSLSGGRIIQDATLMVKAVSDLGGVTKLTEAETKRYNATLTEAIAKVTALGAKAPAEWLKQVDAIKQVEKSTSTLGSIATSAFGQFTAAGLATSAIQKLAGGFGELMTTASKLPATEASFRRLAEGIGQNAAEMRGGMHEATKGLVADYDLMLSANKAMLLGLPVTSQSMADLAKTATVLGKAMGQDATKSLDDLITALGRSSPMILDNLGLTVKVGEANEAYAAKLGKSVDALTDAEKKMAFYEAAMEAARKKQAELGEQATTLGEVFERAWVAASDSATSALAAINVGVGRDIQAFGELLSKFPELIRGHQDLAEAMDDVSTATDRLDDLTIAYKDHTIQLIPVVGAYLDQKQQQARIEEEATEQLEAYNRAVAKAEERAPKTKPTPFEPNKELAALVSYGERIEGVAVSVGHLSKEQEALIRRAAALKQSTSDIAKGLGIEEAAVQSLIDADKRSAQAAQEAARKRAEVFRYMREQAEAGRQAEFKFHLEVVDAVNDMTAAIQRKALPALNDLAHTLLLQPVPPAFQEISKFLSSLPDETKVPIAVNWAGIDMEAKKHLQTFPEAIRDAAKRAGYEVAALIGEGIATGDWSQFENQLADIVGNLIGDAMAAAVNFILPGLGDILKPLFDGIGKAIAKMFGLSTEGRDAVKAFADSFRQIGDLSRGISGFDRLHEQLLRLGDAGERLWKKLTQQTGRGDKAGAERTIDEIKYALQELDKQAEKTLQGLTNFTTGAQKRIEAFAKAFKLDEIKKLKDAIAGEAPEEFMGAMERQARDALAKINPANLLGGGPEEIRKEFAKMGLYAGTAFAQTLREQGIGAALEAAGPMFEQLDELKKQFPDLGLSLEGAAGKFAAFYETAKANQDVMGALDGLTQMIKGAGDAMFLDQELFSAFGEDLNTQFTRLTERGVDANQALILMQPSLQALWEAQQKFGLATDEATQALLDQAEEQGIVGENMRSVNEQMLDVLKEIARVLGADIPDSAKKAGKGVDDAFKNKKYTIPVDFDIENPTIPPPAFVPTENVAASGGMVGRGKILRFPFAAGGPVGTDTVPAWLTPGEIVLNAAQQRNVARNFRAAAGRSQPIIVHVHTHLNRRQVAEEIVPIIPEVVKRYGLA